MDEIKMEDKIEQNSIQLVDGIKKKTKGYCSENIEHLRDLLRQSETRFDDVSEILINIINCEKIPILLHPERNVISISICICSTHLNKYYFLSKSSN